MRSSSRLRALPALVAVVVGLLLALVPARAASAHAELLTTTPGDGALLDEAPDAVALQFTEAVSVRPDGVRVLDSAGERVDLGTSSAAGTTVAVPLDDGLARGSYVVAWRVVSADGHPIRGAFTFSVGERTSVAADAAEGAFEGDGDRVYEVAAAVLRALAYAGALVAAGYVLVGAALHRPGDRSPVDRTSTVAALVGIGALVLQLPVQAALITGRGMAAITETGVLGLALSDGMGLSQLVTEIGLLAIVIAAGLPFEGAVRRVALVGAVVAPLGFVLTGHTRTMSPAAAGYLADAAHVLAASVWLGGLVALFAVVRARRSAEDVLGAADAVARFSGAAAGAAAVVVAAGFALGAIEVGGLDALTSTTYGRLLLAKVAAVLVVLAMGAWNRFRLVPTVAAAALEEPPAEPPRPWRTLVRLLVVEVVVLLGVVALTGVLVNVTPAKAAVAQGPVSATAVLGEGTVDVILDPGRQGPNDVHVYLYDAEGRAEDAYDEVAVRLEQTAQGVGPFDEEAVRIGPGHFQVVATDLALAGEWVITVTVKPDRFTEQSATVTLPVA